MYPEFFILFISTLQQFSSYQRPIEPHRKFSTRKEVFHPKQAKGSFLSIGFGRPFNQSQHLTQFYMDQCMIGLLNSNSMITKMDVQKTWVRSDMTSLRIKQHQSASIKINQHQSASISISQHWSTSINAGQHQPASVCIKQHQSAFISQKRKIMFSGINAQNLNLKMWVQGIKLIVQSPCRN